MSKAERPSEMKRQAGLRLRAVREHLELKQESMANLLGCTRTALANWENGVRLPDVAAMVRLYVRTGITLEWIYAGSLREMRYDEGDALAQHAARSAPWSVLRSQNFRARSSDGLASPP